MSGQAGQRYDETALVCLAKAVSRQTVRSQCWLRSGTVESPEEDT
jgi:hypothetical protein